MRMPNSIDGAARSSTRRDDDAAPPNCSCVISVFGNVFYNTYARIYKIHVATENARDLEGVTRELMANLREREKEREM